VLVIFSFLDEKGIFGYIGLSEFFVAGLPNTVEDCCCETVYCEYFAAAVAEVYEDEHAIFV
jgi:hypothetical protein